MTEAITSVGDIAALLSMGEQNWKQYGDVDIHTSGDLTMFSYGHECQYKPPAEWCYFEKVSRGLIINNKTGEIVARPFDKFWNYGQVEPGLGARIVEVTEKVDGSLGILFWHNDLPWIATRGSFDSDQAVWATLWFREHSTSMIDSIARSAYTILFEIVYPENRVVVDYGGWSGLVVLSARNRFNGSEFALSDMAGIGDFLIDGFRFATRYSFSGMVDILSARDRLTTNEEGFVVRYEDGTRLKIKGDEYLQLHKFVSNFSFKNVAIAVRDEKIDDVMAMCPPNYRDQLVEYIATIAGTIGNLEEEINAAYADVDRYALSQIDVGYTRGEFQKIFALRAQQYYPHIVHYLYAKRDGKYNKAMLYNRTFDL